MSRRSSWLLKSVEPLCKALRDSDAKARLAAVAALEKLDDRKCLEYLYRSLKDEDENVRKACAKAMESLTGESYGLDAEKWKQYLKERGDGGKEK